MLYCNIQGRIFGPGESLQLPIIKLVLYSQNSNQFFLFSRTTYFTEDLRNEMVAVPPTKKLEDLIHLAELCVDLLQQNEEHYAEVSFKI